MTRNLKALGLALVAAFALSAVMASGASAKTAQFTTQAGTVHIDGAQVETDKFFIGTKELTCTTANLKGTAEGPEQSTVTLTPTYETCHAIVTILGFKVTRTATVTMNGCDYVFQATKETNETPYSADLTVTCHEGNEIEIHVYKNSAEPHSEEVLCTYDIHHQTITDAIQLTNTKDANGVMDIHAHVNANVTLTNTIESATCGTGENLNAKYEGTDTLRATNGNEEYIDLTVS
jgi:hypothetical protein